MKAGKNMKKVRIRFCPKCKSDDIDMMAGGITGMWQCRNCNFTSPIFPEREVEVEDKMDNKVDRKKKQNRSKEKK